MDQTKPSVRKRLQRIGAYALCRRSDQLLLSRYAPPDGRWVLPGGGVGHGEDPEDAVRREVEEETGYRCRIIALIGVRSSTWSTDDTDIHSVALVYEAEVVEGALRDEVHGSSDKAAWISRDDLPHVAHTALVDWTLARASTA